jgi:hypothetical protein
MFRMADIACTQHFARELDYEEEKTVAVEAGSCEFGTQEADGKAQAEVFEDADRLVRSS